VYWSFTGVVGFVATDRHQPSANMMGDNGDEDDDAKRPPPG